MVKPLRLALYLATRARLDRGVERAESDALLTERDKARLGERQGLTDKSRPRGRLIWIHTGQTSAPQAVDEFIERMLGDNDDLRFLRTTSASVRPDSTPLVTAQLAPDENRAAIRRFLTLWSPDVAVWTEPDLRPALAEDAALAGIPLIFADTDTAPHVVQPRRWWSGVSMDLLTRFRHLLTGTEAAAARLARLGAAAERIEVKGFLQEGSSALPCNESERAALTTQLYARPVWLAAPIPADERDAVIDAHLQAIRLAHRLLLILVPDKTEQGAVWATELAEKGIKVALRSADQTPDDQTQVYIADTRGEMGLWYRLAPVSFLGRSLNPAPENGTDPQQAAALGSAILHGPHIGKHKALYNRLDTANAAAMVANGQILARQVEHLLAPDLAATMAHAAWNIISDGAETTDRLKDLILETLQEQEDR